MEMDYSMFLMRYFQKIISCQSIDEVDDVVKLFEGSQRMLKESIFKNDETNIGVRYKINQIFDAVFILSNHLAEDRKHLLAKRIINPLHKIGEGDK